MRVRRTIKLKKSSRGLMSYVVLIGTFLLIAILLNGSLSDPVNKRIEYPELLKMIQADPPGRAGEVPFPDASQGSRRTARQGLRHPPAAATPQ